MKRISLFQIVFATLLGLLFIPFFSVKAMAKAVDVSYRLEYFVDSQDTMRVRETHTIKNNSTTTILKKENRDVFIISHTKNSGADLKDSVASVKVMADGKNVPVKTEYKEGYVEIIVEYPRRVNTNDTLTIVMEYQNHGLIEKTGALYDIYVPGISSASVYENENQSFSINTDVYLSNGIFPEKNFVLPKASSEAQLEGNVTKYSFNRDDITGKQIWIQMGRTQYYHFSIKQQAEPTITTDIGFQNEYSLVLPRNVENLEIYQKVYFDKILPLPDYVSQDKDGNLIAHFRIPSTQKAEILVEGYVEVGLTGAQFDSGKAGTLTQITAGEFDSSLKAAEYWEVSDPLIVKTAKEIAGTESNVLTLLGKTFNYVTNRIDYSEVKRLGLNNRQGALATLKSGSGVCMEYADLFLSLARAQGIPTRAAFGYAYDPKEDTAAQESHQWVVSYLPGLNKWYDLDVTWGDTGQIGEAGYLNRFYTHMVSTGPNSVPEISVNAYGNNNNLSLPSYSIDAVEKLPEVNGFKKQADLLAAYAGRPQASLMDAVLGIPLKISSYFNDVTNKDALSITLLTVGFILIIAPVVLVFRKQIVK